MTPQQFTIAQQMEKEGWEYTGLSDDGGLTFFRYFGTMPMVVDMREDS